MLVIPTSEMIVQPLPAPISIMQAISVEEPQKIVG
jgi:hypothetical protein